MGNRYWHHCIHHQQWWWYRHRQQSFGFRRKSKNFCGCTISFESVQRPVRWEWWEERVDEKDEKIVFVLRRKSKNFCAHTISFESVQTPVTKRLIPVWKWLEVRIDENKKDATAMDVEKWTIKNMPPRILKFLTLITFV